MARAKKPGKTKVATKRPAARKSAPRRAAKPSLARQLTEALEQQAATAEILRVISNSRTDVQPVFDVIAQSGARLCDAEFCHVFRFDGSLLYFEASHGLAPKVVTAVRRAYPMAPGRGTAAARSILSGAVEQIPDVHADPDYAHGAIAKLVTFRSIMAVPMLRDGVAIGSIAVARSQSGFFPDRRSSSSRRSQTRRSSRSRTSAHSRNSRRAIAISLRRWSNRRRRAKFCA